MVANTLCACVSFFYRVKQKHVVPTLVLRSQQKSSGSMFVLDKYVLAIPCLDSVGSRAQEN
jgi:hypothetical protein